MEGPPLVEPVGTPQVYGPQFTYHAPVGNPMLPGGRLEGAAIQGGEQGSVRMLDHNLDLPLNESMENFRAVEMV